MNNDLTKLVNELVEAEMPQGYAVRFDDLHGLAHRVKDLVLQHQRETALVWESTTCCYVKYITQARYEKFSPAVRKWYKPVQNPVSKDVKEFKTVVVPHVPCWNGKPISEYATVWLQDELERNKTQFNVRFNSRDIKAELQARGVS